jgi:hypothetical protein
MAQSDRLKRFKNGGMDTNSALEDVSAEDFISAYNVRVTGTQLSEDGYATNPESTLLITQLMPAGINKGIGGSAFENTRIIAYFRYNSFGLNQIVIYSKDTKTERVIYEDKTNSAGQILLPLDPQSYVKAKLINETYLAWVANGLTIGFTNLNTLTSGGYGTVLAEDLSLIKPPNLLPINGVYASDAGKASNFVKGKLFQFTNQYITQDFNYTAWGTWSKRFIPLQESTPIVGADVRVNNCIIVSVNIGSIRVLTINIAARSGLLNFGTIKSVDRSYVVALPNTAINISTEIYEAYDPATNLYSFIFYNDSLDIPINPTEIDQLFDTVPLSAGAIEIINGDIIGIGDLVEGYNRPTTTATLRAVGYDPNITVDISTNPNPFKIISTFPGETGSGAGNHRRIMRITLGGSPQTNDTITIVDADIRAAVSTRTYYYPVPSGLNHNLAGVVSAYASGLPNSSYVDNGDGTFTITYIDQPYYGMQSAAIKLYSAGAAISKSIHSILDNSSYQLSLLHYDKYGRPFPIETNNTFIVKTPSYAQLLGQAVQISWTLTGLPPTSSATAQWAITTNNTVTPGALLDVLGTPINYKGVWNAKTNTPTLSANEVGAKIGDAYQITAASDPTGTVNLGKGNVQYLTQNYVVYNGSSWDQLDKNYGDLTPSGNIVAIKINPLQIFNDQYTNQGINTILHYDFSVGDRCTLHYYIDGGGVKNYINNPPVDLVVYGYDLVTNLVKIEKSATFDFSTISGDNIFIRLYSPIQQSQAASLVQNSTVWYEIGEIIPITNGVYSKLTGNITDGDVYYKSRSYAGAIDPNNQYSVAATDFNFSDFYPSAFTSYGRPRVYNDVLEQAEHKANIRTSQNFILGSKNNGLTKFYAADVYGEGDGQTSSDKGAIGVLWQIGSVLRAIQERGVFYIPVNEAYTVLNPQLTGQSISEKLLNNGRYDTMGIGIGTAKEAFCYNESTGYFIDPIRSEPYEITTGGIFPIGHKMTKALRAIFGLAYASNKKILLTYNRYYDEVIAFIEADGGILTLFPFIPSSWNAFEAYTILPADVTVTNNGAHSTVAYNNATGIATYTPAANYVGNDTATFVYNAPGGPFTKNVCLNWIAGGTVVNPFSFSPATEQQLGATVLSNTIGVNGNGIPVPISITGGQYSINGGAFTSASGMVNAGDSVQVSGVSSATPETTTNVVLTISTTTGTFAITTYHKIIVQGINTDGTNPFSDSNVDVKNNGIDIIRQTATGSFGPFTLQSRLPLSVEGFSELPSTGSTPMKTLQVKRNGVIIYGPTTNANSPGSPSLLFGETGVDDATYDITMSAAATAFSASTVGILVVDIFSNTTINICGYVDSPAIVTPYHQAVYTGLNFEPNTPLNPEACYELASDLISGMGTTNWRVQFNLAAMQSQYPGVNPIVSVIRGRDIGAGTISGQYSTYGANTGKMTMAGAPGSYIPGETGATLIATTAYAGRATVGGADGTYGVGVGAVILTFTYDTIAQTMTLT